jgi:helicase
MDIKDLIGKVPGEMIESLENRRITTLTPPQALSIEKGLTNGSHLVVAAPTASGKTLIAELAAIKSVMWDRKKAVYIAPMRALVREKYDEFRSAYPYLKMAMSIGDLDSLDKWLDEYDIIFASTEKFDSLIRHGLGWLGEIGCIIVDEVHMLDDDSRGPTLEILISKLKRMCKGAQIIALSATIGNAKEIAQWMGAQLVESNYRPVLLERGIELEGNVAYDTGREEQLDSSQGIAELRVTEDTLKKGKQLMIFYSTKRNTEAGADRLAAIVAKYLSDQDREYLKGLGDKVLNVLDKPTAQCERLAKDILKGVAFHHGGLVNRQREIVEEAFKENRIKAISSTTTLGYGVNLPAHTVLVRDIVRYGESSGSEYIGINEVTQLFGRAGRPKYDRIGRAMLISRSKAEAQDLYNRYFLSDLDPVESKLGILPVLRTHILAFVATRFLTSKESIMDFMGSTFYGFQFSNSRELDNIVAEVLEELCEWGFVERSGSIYASTRVGQRVSELYIDPMSAKWMIDSMPGLADDVSVLFMISNTVEMRPYVKATADAEHKYAEYQQMVNNSPARYGAGDIMFYDPIKPFSTALMLNEWASERAERDIIKDYRTTPGALYTKITNADWLLYSAMEIAKLVRVRNPRLLEMRMRVKYGIKRELLDLIRLEQVGRVRARLMYNNGIQRAHDIRRPESQQAIRKLFGNDIAQRIISQVAGGVG